MSGKRTCFLCFLSHSSALGCKNQRTRLTQLITLPGDSLRTGELAVLTHVSGTRDLFSVAVWFLLAATLLHFSQQQYFHVVIPAIVQLAPRDHAIRASAAIAQASARSVSARSGLAATPITRYPLPIVQRTRIRNNRAVQLWPVADFMRPLSLRHSPNGPCVSPGLLVCPVPTTTNGGINSAALFCALGAQEHCHIQYNGTQAAHNEQSNQPRKSRYKHGGKEGEEKREAEG